MADGFNVLDIETEGWDRFVVGGLLCADGTYIERWHDAEDDLVDAVLAVEGDVWSHNGGRFDALWLLDHASRRGLRVAATMAGGRVVAARIGRTTIRDSYALIPMALRTAAGIAGGGVSKGETGLPCSCGGACGGYCSIRRDMPAPLRRRLGEYLRRDCDTLAAVLGALDTFAAREGIPLRGTVGATAWAWASAMLRLPKATWGDAGLYRLARGSYYGGRTEVYRTSAPRGHRYDIRSSYPAALVAAEVPIGPPRLVADGRAAYESGAPCAVGALVVVPEGTHVPPLPVRVGERLLFPVGRFAGVWPALELRAAEAAGATIERIGAAVVTPDRGRVLAPWCAHVWGLRAAAEERGEAALARWLKSIANSLTGKLGQDPQGESLVLSPGNPTPCKCGRIPCSGRCGAYTPLDPLGRAWVRGYWRIPACGHVLWCATSTAHARVELGEQLCHAGTAACYCDTDAVYAAKRLARRVGGDLGEWKYEGAMSEFVALAPKVYRYRAADGAGVVHAKGIGRATWDAFDTLAAGGEVDASTGVMGLRSALRRGGPLFVRSHLSRRLHGLGGPLVGGRERDGQLTRAITVERFQTLSGLGDGAEAEGDETY